MTKKATSATSGNVQSKSNPVPAQVAGQIELKASAQPSNPETASPVQTSGQPEVIKPTGIVKPKSGDLLLKNLNECTDQIKRAMTSVARSFLYIGYRLWECREDKTYEALGYKNVYEYSEAELGFKRSSTGNFIKVCEKFAERLSDTGRPTYNITKSAEQFSYSQLVEMLALGDGLTEKVTPDMTVKEIRALKSGKADEDTDDGSESGSGEKVQTSGQKVNLVDSKSYTVALPVSMSKQLDSFIQANRIPVEVIFRDALKDYLDSYKKPLSAAEAAKPAKSPSKTPTKSPASKPAKAPAVENKATPVPAPAPTPAVVPSTAQ